MIYLLDELHKLKEKITSDLHSRLDDDYMTYDCEFADTIVQNKYDRYFTKSLIKKSSNLELDLCQVAVDEIMFSDNINIEVIKI